MFYMIPKDIYTNQNFMSNEFTFPTILFLEEHKSKSRVVYTTIGCIMDRYNISQLSKNTIKIKLLLIELSNIGYIEFEQEIVNFNTPIKIVVRSYEQGDIFTTVQDYELESIINIVSNNNISYMIMNMFIALKRRAGFINILKNEYESVTISYRKLMDEIGVKSFNTMSKYVSLLEKVELLRVDRKNTNTEDGLKTINEYSFKKLD